MTAGLFERTYEVWRIDSVPDGGGGFTKEWVKQADVSGRAYPARVTEESIRNSQGLKGKIVWTFAAGKDADIQEFDHVRFDGRILLVRAVSVTGSGRRIEAMCEESRY